MTFRLDVEVMFQDVTRLAILVTTSIQGYLPVS